MAPVDSTTAPEPAVDQGPAADDPRAGSSVTGLSGLSDLMQAEPNRAPAPAPGDSAVGGAPPTIQEAKFASPEAAQRLTQAAASLKHSAPSGMMSRQSRRWAILIIALLAFSVALVGLGLATLGGNKNATNSAASPEGLGTPDPTHTPQPPDSNHTQPNAPRLDITGPPARPNLDPDGAG